MRRLIARSAALGATIGLLSCGLFRHDVNITLSPDATFTIQSGASSMQRQTQHPITVDPAIAGKDYTDNKSKIDSATLKSMTIDIVNIYPDNRATKLLSGASLTLTNLSNGQTQTFTVSEISITPNASNTLTAFNPDPSGFLTTILKNGSSFTVEASGTIDNAPVHIDVKVHLGVTMSVNLL